MVREAEAKVVPSFCVAIRLSPALARQFPRDQGGTIEPEVALLEATGVTAPHVTAPHVTVLYFNPKDEDEATKARDVLRSLVSRTDAFELHLVGGQANFDPSEASDRKKVAWAPVLSHGAFDLHHALTLALEQAGIKLKPSHRGYVAHATLGYIEPNQRWVSPLPEGLANIREIELWRGGKIEVFKLGIPLTENFRSRRDPLYVPLRERIEEMFESQDLSFPDQLLEDIGVDSGTKGKALETSFYRIADALGLAYETNTSTGKFWDIRFISKAWALGIRGQRANLKQFKTKWLFASNKLVDMLPWATQEGEGKARSRTAPEGYDFETYDTEKAAQEVQAFLATTPLAKIIYLRPSSEAAEAAVIAAVEGGDLKEMVAAFQARNFSFYKLDDITVKVSKREDGVGSIALVQDGKVVGRSEAPRMMGGSLMVAFRVERAPKATQVAVLAKTFKLPESRSRRLLQGR